MRSRSNSSGVVALLLSVAACGGGSPSSASGRDASADGANGSDGGTGDDAGSTDEDSDVADGGASAPGDDGGSGGYGPGAGAAPCSTDDNGKYVVSCLVGAGTVLPPECVEDHTTLAECMMEAENCVGNGAVAGPGCPTADLAGCCFTPSTGAENCLYNGDAQDDEQTCHENGGVWSTTP